MSTNIINFDSIRVIRVIRGQSTASLRLSHLNIQAWAALLLALSTTQALPQPTERFVNGGFEQGLKSWEVLGDVHLETNRPAVGKASVVIGPGAGSVRQRVETGSGNDLIVSALIESPLTNGSTFTVCCLDQNGREVMRVDSTTDMERSKNDARKFSHYMKAHPLTKWIELVISKGAVEGQVLVDDVGLEMEDENAANLRPTCDLAQEMQPFWMGKRVFNEAVLLVSKDGKPAAGRLLFRPSRILSVRDYGLATNYSEGVDYTLDERTLLCTASSRMLRVRDEDLPKGELKWSTVGGKQVMVTYEHGDIWNYQPPTFVGDRLPHTISKLKARAPLTVVAYGDSITYGLGESRLSHIPPFLPPWPELFVYRLKTIYHDDQIRFYNSAQSGANSKWARDYAERMVASLNPDLALIAFGQNDFWGISASSFADNIKATIDTVRKKKPKAEFLLVSTMRFDPVYTTNAEYWGRVSEYAKQLQAMAGPGVGFVDMTAISESLYAAKQPKDCLNDPLHPNDYLARWYAQSVAAALTSPSSRALLPIQESKRTTAQPEDNN